MNIKEAPKMAHITNKDILNTLTEDMNQANQFLMETAPDRFNRNLLNKIQREIEIGKAAAQRHQHTDPDSRIYVHYSQFPLAIYQAMSADLLKELQDLNIVIYRKDNLNTAGIKIVFHF